MKTFNNIKDFKSLTAAENGLGLAIGNFDGCHLGHQKLLRLMVSESRKLGVPACVLTFFPRPDAFFKSLDTEKLLFNTDQKNRALQELGVDYHIIQPFNYEFSQISHDAFTQDILLNTLNIKLLVVGDNFRFGNKRKGDIDYLKAACGTANIDFHPVAPEILPNSDTLISSTVVRHLIADGKVKEAAQLLGRHYLLEGDVINGDQIGRQLGFPTANLDIMSIRNQLIPESGVYAAYVDYELSNYSIFEKSDSLCLAAVNIGYRPTLKIKEPQLHFEVHIIDKKDIDLYGKSIGVYLVEKIRPEQKFADLDELKRQIAADILNIKKLIF